MRIILRTMDLPALYRPRKSPIERQFKGSQLRVLNLGFPKLGAKICARRVKFAWHCYLAMVTLSFQPASLSSGSLSKVKLKEFEAT